MKRSAFLPAFFVVLGIAFIVAVWLRLNTLDAGDGPAAGKDELATTAPRPRPSPTDSTSPDDNAPVTESGRSEAQQARAREEKYNELLRSAPPPPPASRPSLFERAVGSAAAALGISRNAPAQTAPATPPVAPRPQPAQSQQQPRAAEPQHGESPSQKEAARDSREEPDDETDVVPPQLLAAEFNPRQVEDGGETIFSVRVSDNLSGVRGVSGVVASPGGALQGFACQKEGEGDRFVTRIKLPQGAAEGLWTVKYLTLSDNANNSVNLNQGAALPPTAAFHVVSSQSDSAAPLLKGITLERRAMSAGERNTLVIQAEDEKSGVGLVSGVFVSPSKQARIGFGCTGGNGGAWECTIAPPTCLDCGTWQLEQVQIQDKANNMATFRSDNPIVQPINVNITGEQCDSGPPRIVSLSVAPPVVSNAEGGTIEIAAIVQDDACGVASLSGQAMPSASGGQKIYFSFDPTQDGQNYYGRIVVPRFAAKGTWVINWIQTLDKGHNLRAYSSNDPVLARVTFRVE